MKNKLLKVYGQKNELLRKFRNENDILTFNLVENLMCSTSSKYT